MTISFFRRFLFALSALLAGTVRGEALAFSGAEGWGRLAKGGRGGDVYRVTTLADDGPGSLRHGIVSATVPRTIVFAISGTIVLESPLIIEKSNLTIAGQTAPGDGITLRRHDLRIRSAEDVIVRFLRVRLGSEAGKELDGISIARSRNVIVDHCSISWTIDEAVNNWHGTEYTTFQWCIISEPLNRSVHSRGVHGYGASIGSMSASFHHNLFAHAHARNPSVAGNAAYPTQLMDFRNNLIYNWAIRSGDGKPHSANVVDNYYKPGPDTQPGVLRRIVRIDDASRYGFKGRWYVEGNYVEGFPLISADNWAGGVDFDPGTSESQNRAREPFNVPAVTQRTPAETFEIVLAHAGATHPRRDVVDKRIIAEVRARSGRIIDHPDEVGGWPVLASGPVPADSDGDGMPDAWEQANGLNPYDPEDRNRRDHHEYYTNLEVYLSSLVSAAPSS